MIVEENQIYFSNKEAMFFYFLILPAILVGSIFSRSILIFCFICVEITSLK
jgi:hypothetical protein